MATARETLFEEILKLAEMPAGDDAGEQVRQVMLRYRVQTKPGVATKDGLTARDDLGDRLLAIWQSQPDDKAKQIGDEIDKFRMQNKTKSTAKKASSSRRAAPARPQARAPAMPEPLAAAEMPAPEPAGRPRSTPVAGGPRRRGKTRSECPKCHSMGVVLARSYAGDEYYSCIYCGWQAFKPADENDPTASLAGRLLGQTKS